LKEKKIQETIKERKSRRNAREKYIDELEARSPKTMGSYLIKNRSE
jgi:hypothetical protein